jgi:hypothetical protein
MREGFVHGCFYGWKIFGCKTAQLSETLRESEMAETRDALAL